MLAWVFGLGLLPAALTTNRTNYTNLVDDGGRWWLGFCAWLMLFGPRNTLKFAWVVMAWVVCLGCGGDWKSRVHFLEVAGAGGAGEGDDVANVFHACGEHEHALESQAKARVGAGAVFAEVCVPPVVFLVEVVGSHV